MKKIALAAAAALVIATLSVTPTQASPAPQVRVVAPNGGESWPNGTTKQIRWKFTEGKPDAVRIVLVRYSKFVQEIAAAAPTGALGNGAYGWVVPGDVPTGPGYRVRITINGFTPVIGDNSNAAFTIES